MNEVEPHKGPRGEVEARHIPQVVVAVPFDHVRDFVRDALRGSSLVDPVASVLSGWVFFEPHLRFTPVDPEHTRIELDVVGTAPGAETFLFVQRRAEIHRFFVAVQDELDRRERWRPQLPSRSAPIEGSD